MQKNQKTRLAGAAGQAVRILNIRIAGISSDFF
jgi:hypothetical protein